MDAAINDSTANYTCNEGFALNGTETRVCQASGEWEPEEPSCYGKGARGEGEGCAGIGAFEC